MFTNGRCGHSVSATRSRLSSLAQSRDATSRGSRFRWTTFRISRGEVAEHAIWLMRQSYLRYALKSAADPGCLPEKEDERLHLHPELKSMRAHFILSRIAVVKNRTSLVQQFILTNATTGHRPTHSTVPIEGDSIVKDLVASGPVSLSMRRFTRFSIGRRLIRDTSASRCWLRISDFPTSRRRRRKQCAVVVILTL